MNNDQLIPEEYYNLYGISFRVSGDIERCRDEFELSAKLMMAQMKQMNTGNLDHIWATRRFEGGEQVRVESRFGHNSAEIYVPFTIGGGKKQKEKIIERTSEDYVLLVEMVRSRLTDIPSAFAVFEPVEEGKLGFAGWTNLVTENQDPLGIIGQETNRPGWCDSPADGERAPGVPWESLEQVKRVDQGWCAYPGDEYEEEATANGCYSNYWTYENIAADYVWKSVDPGPPPEAACGYSWTINPAYGGQDGDADYHDERHLFYMVSVGGKYPYWWPPEFNQLIEIEWIHNQEGGVCKWVDMDHSAWDQAFYDGVEVACADILFKNTYTAMKIITDQTRRVWGVVWGTAFLGLDDFVDADFPYTSYVADQASVYEKISDFIRQFPSEGVYVYEDASFFIQGLVRWDAPYSSASTYRVNKRVAIDPVARFTAPAGLTARQLTLLEGNEDSCDVWWPLSGGRAYSRDGLAEVTPGDIMINCGGVEHYITSQTIIGSYDYRGITYRQVRSAFFMDYGIFTKEDTGVDAENRILSDEIDPVYAYALVIGYPVGYDSDNIIYGLCVDGQNYVTEEFKSPTYGLYNVPEAEDAVDTDGNPLACTYKVRVAIRKAGMLEIIKEEPTVF